jgi:prevent-host-death family protein
MRLEKAIQPISYLKAHAADLVEELSRNHEPLIVTQNGKARLVVQDIASFEKTQETLALLKLLVQSQREVAQGKGIPVEEAFRLLRSRKRAPGQTGPGSAKAPLGKPA